MQKEAPSSLALFIPPEECLDVLDSGKAAWFAPHMIKDPFENSIRTTLAFDRSQLEREMISKISEMVFSFEDPNGAGKNTPIQKAIRRWRSEDRFNTEEEVAAALTEVVPGLVGQHYDNIINYMGRWQAFSTAVRMLRLYESVESVSCWAEHAGGHQGIAVKLKVGKGNMLLEPQGVMYRQARCFVTALKDQVDIILGDVSESRENHFFDQLLVKPRYQSEQKEWRAFFLSDHFQLSGDGDASDYSYPYNENPTINEHAILRKPFDSSEVLAIYLGAGVAEQHGKDLIKICKSKYGHAKLFKGRAKENEYEVAFDRI